MGEAVLGLRVVLVVDMGPPGDEQVPEVIGLALERVEARDVEEHVGPAHLRAGLGGRRKGLPHLVQVGILPGNVLQAPFVGDRATRVEGLAGEAHAKHGVVHRETDDGEVALAGRHLNHRRGDVAARRGAHGHEAAARDVELLRMAVAPDHGVVAGGVRHRVLMLGRAGVVHVDDDRPGPVGHEPAVRDVELPVAKAEAAAVEVEDHHVARALARVVEVEVEPARVGPHRTLHARVVDPELVAVRPVPQLLSHAVCVDVLVLDGRDVRQLALACHASSPLLTAPWRLIALTKWERSH